MKKPKLGKDIAAIPSYIAPYHSRMDIDELVAVLVYLKGTGFVCGPPLFTKKDAKKKGKQKDGMLPVPVVGDFSGQVDAMEIPEMKLRYKDFLAFSYGRILGDKYLLDQYIGELVVEAAHPTLDRCDRVVLEPATDANGNYCNQGGVWKILKGTPSASPEMPPKEHEQQITAAKVTVRAGTTSILTTDIDNDNYKECVLTGDDIKSKFAEITVPDVSGLDARITALEDLLYGATAPVGVIADILSDLGTLSDQIDEIKNQECTDTVLISALSTGTAAASAAQLITDKASLVAATAGESAELKIKVSGSAAKADRIKASVDSLATLVAGLSAASALMNEDILGLKLDVSYVGKQIIELYDELSSLSLTGAADTARDAMQADLLAIQAQLSPMMGQIAALVNCVQLSAVNMPSMQALMSVIGGKLGQITSDLTNIRGEFDKLQDEFISVKLKVEDNSARLDVLEELVGMRGDIHCKTFGSAGSGAGQFNFPWYMGTGPDGKIYTAEVGNARIGINNADGSDAGSIDVSAQFGIAACVAVNPAGTLMAVGGNTNKIALYNLPAGTLNTEIGSFGSLNGEFNLAIDVSFDAAGNLWVCDFNNHRLQKFTAGTWAHAQTVAGPDSGLTTAPLKFFLPRSVFVEQTSGDIYVTETNTGGNRVLRLDSAGNFLNLIGQGSSGDVTFQDWTGLVHLGTGFAQRNHLVEMNDGNLLWALSYRFSVILDSNGNPISGFVNNGLNGPLTDNGSFGRVHGAVKIPAGVNSGRVVQVGSSFNQNTGKSEMWTSYSDDNAATWNPQAAFDLPLGFDVNYSQVDGELTVDPVNGDLYFGVHEYTNTAAILIKSTDGGLTWSVVNSDVFPGASPVDMSLVCYGNGLLLAQTNGGRQSRSTDGGATFTYEGNTGITLLGNPYIYKMSDGRMVITGIENVVGPGSGMNFQISNDDGASWGAEFSPSAFDGWTVAIGTFTEMSDGRVAFTDFDNNVNDDAVIFAEPGGAFIGAGNGQFNRPQQAAANADGVYVCDRGNSRIQVFDTAGKFLYKFFPGRVRNGATDLEYGNLGGMTLGSDGSVWASDIAQNYLFKCTKPETVIAKTNEIIDALDALATELAGTPPALGKL